MNSVHGCQLCFLSTTRDQKVFSLTPAALGSKTCDGSCRYCLQWPQMDQLQLLMCWGEVVSVLQPLHSGFYWDWKVRRLLTFYLGLGTVWAADVRQTSCENLLLRLNFSDRILSFTSGEFCPNIHPNHLNEQIYFTLNMAACGSPSSWNGGLLVAISMMVQPKDQISAGAPYPRGPWSIISGAMYCRVPMWKTNEQRLWGTILLKSGP